MKHLMLAAVEPVEGKEDEFREWYKSGNVASILGIDGFASLQRFELSDVEGNEGPYRFLAIYEIEDDKLEQVAAAWDRVQREREEAEKAGRAAKVGVAPSIQVAIRCYFTAITDRLVPDRGGPAR